LRIPLPAPNDLYCVLEADATTGTGGKLYLSSDGTGAMKLKEWNHPLPGPLFSIGARDVDPSLLFRTVIP
jgi:hypothetical protein